MNDAVELPTAASEWATWIRGLGRHGRRVREFLGLSQEQLARMAGVSQGAVSRLEAGRGLATPLVVVMRITGAMRRVVATIDPELLSPDALRLLATDPPWAPAFRPGPIAPYSILADPVLEELIRLYRSVPDRHRGKVLSVVRATVSALTSDEARVAGARTGGVDHGR